MVWWVLGGGGLAVLERAWAWCGGGVASRAEEAGWKPAGTQDGEGAERETLEEGEEAVEPRGGGGHVGGVAGLTQIVYIV